MKKIGDKVKVQINPEIDRLRKRSSTHIIGTIVDIEIDSKFGIESADYLIRFNSWDTPRWIKGDYVEGGIKGKVIA